MLLNAHTREYELGKSLLFQASAAVLCTMLLAFFVWAVSKGQVATPMQGMTPEKIDSLGGNVQVLSEVLFSDYVLPFELTSLLLLVGIAGSVALAKRKLGS
jgi:NADH-quinone oxidoreductase subunit J